MAALSCLVAPAFAQQATLLPDEGASVLADCVEHVNGKDAQIQYPKGALELNEHGLVRVQMTFAFADRGPRVSVLFSTAGAFEARVLSHVRGYRLPCMKDRTSPVTFNQEFFFDPRDGRTSELVRVVETPNVGQCRTVGATPRSIRYPDAAMARNESGAVLAMLRFNGPDIAPAVDILFDGGSKALGQAVKTHLSDMRLSCNDGQVKWPIKALQVVKFRIEGNPAWVLKDRALRDLLVAVDDIDSHKVRFDFDSMGCPFDVDMSLYQPYMANAVGQVGKPDPNRQAFLHWLSRIKLRIQPETLRHVLGDTIRISVPCGSLDLTS